MWSYTAWGRVCEVRPLYCWCWTEQRAPCVDVREGETVLVRITASVELLLVQSSQPNFLLLSESSGNFE